MGSAFKEVIELAIQSTGNEQLRVLLKSLRDVGDVGELSGEQVSGFVDELDRLSKDQAATQGLQKSASAFKVLGRSVIETEKSIRDARDRVAELGKAISAAEAPTKKQIQDFESSRRELSRLNAVQDKQRANLLSIKSALGEAGLETRNLVAAEKELAERTARSESAVESLVSATRKEIKVRSEAAQRSKEINEQLKRSEGDYKRLADAVEASNRRIGKDVLAYVRNTAGEYKRLSASAKESATAQVAAVESGNARITKSYGKTTDAVGLLRKGLGALGIAFSLSTIKDGIVSILGVGDAAERTKIQLAQLYGTQAEGNKAYEELRTLAKETGQSFQGVLEAAARLKATGLEPLDGTLKSLINQTAALGGSQETLTGIGLALGQMYAKQKIQTEEILQLVERGVPAFDLLAKVTGKQGTELQKLIQSGSLGRTTIKALIDEIGRASDGAAAKSLNTLSGLVTQLKDQFAAFLERISNSGAADFFKAKLTGIRNEIELMVNDGRLQKFAEDTSNSITQIGGAISAVTEKWRVFKGVIDVVTGAAAYSLTLSQEAGAKAVAAITETFTSITGLGENISRTFRDIADGLSGQLSDSLDKAKGGANALGASFELASSKGAQLAASFDNVKSGADSTASAFRNVQSGIDSTAAKVIDMGKAADYAAQKSEKLAEAFKTLGVKSSAELQDAAKKAEEALNTIVASYQAGGGATAATTEDVANAFKKYSEAQRATVADSKEFEKAGVEGALNIKAALLGLSDIEPPKLKAPDLANYSDAISSVKSENDAAAESIKGVGDQANATSGDVGNAAQAIQNIYSGFAGELGKTSTAAIEQFTKLTRQIFELSAGIADFSGLARFGKAAEDAYNIINGKIEQQKLGVAALAGQYANLSDEAIRDMIRLGGGVDAAAASVDLLAQGAREGKTEFDLLGQQDLGALASAADAAAAKVRQIGEAAKAAKEQLQGIADSLQDELDRAAGRNADIEKRRYEQQLADIRQLAEESGNLNSAEYNAALARAKRVHDLNLRNIAEEKKAREASKAATDSTSAAGGGTNTPAPGPSPSPTPLPKPGGAQRAAPGSNSYALTFNINGNTADVVREVKRQLDEIARRSR
jgi:tape measure domain-containing protein